MRIGIIGGGIMGITLGYFLSRQGVEVDIYEASPILGGLAGPLILEDGVAVDRFYHAILSSDRHLAKLCAELDLTNQLRFRETRMGFYHHGQIYSMNNVVEFLRFPLLGWFDRFRLGLTVVAAQFIRDWRKLESISVEDWLIRLGGRRTYELIWRPLLKAKFDGSFTDTPATYIWARLVRTKSTRGGASQKEMAGHLIGGYSTLLGAMARHIEASGGRIFLHRPVQEIVIEKGQARGVRTEGEIYLYDAIIATVQTPIFARLIPGAGEEYLAYLKQIQYMGIICPLLVLDRPLSEYWTINITDDQIPFTGVIETTSYIDPQYVGGHHLVYLPKYTAPDSAWQRFSDEEIKSIWLQHLERMFPGFDRRSTRYFLVHRERYVEPIHRLNSTHLIPPVTTPIDRLYLSTTAQIYPELTNGESVTRHAYNSAKVILSNLLETVRATPLEPEWATYLVGLDVE